MLAEKTHTLRAHPSLFPLRAALIAAERESPPCPQPDANEKLALRLIEKMQAGYKGQPPVLSRKDIPGQVGVHANTREMAGVHAR